MSGEYRGRGIVSPENFDIRPTTGRIKGSLFNIIRNGLYGKVFLDLFGGSGLMSLEAISRGYIVKTIEKDKNTYSVIKNNFKKLRISGDLILGDCVKFLKSNDEKFDVIYIDPPWSDSDFKYSYKDIIELALLNLKNDGIIVLEQDKIKKLLHKDLESLSEKLIREKVYGRCLLSFYKN